MVFVNNYFTRVMRQLGKGVGAKTSINKGVNKILVILSRSRYAHCVNIYQEVINNCDKLAFNEECLIFSCRDAETRRNMV